MNWTHWVWNGCSPPSPSAISLSQLAVVPALPLHAFKTLHTLISASPWLPRHLEVIIQQSTAQSSIMKHHISHQCLAFCLWSWCVRVPTCSICLTSNPVSLFNGQSFCSWFLHIFRLLLFWIWQIAKRSSFDLCNSKTGLKLFETTSVRMKVNPFRARVTYSSLQSQMQNANSLLMPHLESVFVSIVLWLICLLFRFNKPGAYLFSGFTHSF